MTIQEYLERMRETRPKGWMAFIGSLGVLAIVIIVIAGIKQYPILSVALITAIIGFVFKQLFLGHESVRELFKKKRLLLRELQLTETAYFKRQLNESDYRALLNKKNKELIELDAQIEQFLEKQTGKNQETWIVGALELRKKYQLKQLQEQLERLEKEQRLTEEKFQHRKIDQRIYQELVGQATDKKIKVNAQMKELYGEEQINAELRETKQRVRELVRENKPITKETVNAIAEDISREIINELVARDREERERKQA